MLSDVLAAADFQTAAFVASFVMDARFGLNRGFQVYDNEIRDTSHKVDVLHRERNGAAVVDLALRWLKTRQPFSILLLGPPAQSPFSVSIASTRVRRKTQGASL